MEGQFDFDGFVQMVQTSGQDTCHEGLAGNQVLRAGPVVTERVEDPFADAPEASAAELGEHFRAIVDATIFHNEENGYCVLSVSAGKGKGRVKTKCVGNIPQEPTEGLEYEFTGDWTNHPRFGKQFAFKTARQVRPTDAEGILRYLASGVLPGVKESLAHAIVAHFGDRTLEMLDLLDEQVLVQVPGIGPVKAAGIVEAWAEQEKYREVSIKLMQLGISASLCVKIIKHFERLGQDAWGGVMEDPYCLTELWGVGFKTADRIGRSVGIGTKDERRLRAAAVYVLQQARDIEGHCYLLEEGVAEGVIELCGLTVPEVRVWLDEADGDLQYLRSVVVEESETAGELAGRRHYLHRMHHDEVELAGRLKALGEAVPLYRAASMDWMSAETLQDTFSLQVGYRLTEEQLDATGALMNARLGILTGGPGVGKTAITRALVMLAEAAGLEVALASPTGRAAKRLEEMTGHAASTLHRLLGWSQEGHHFVHCKEDPLPHDLVIVDEASMVDVSLGRALADAIAPGRTQLLLVGDKDQLPSVGPGSVLNDVIRSEVAVVRELTQIMRQAEGSGIVTDAHLVNHGKLPAMDTADCTFVAAETEQAQRVVLALAAHTATSGGTPPHEAEATINGWDEIQILTPMRKGPLGTVALNKLLQAKLNCPAQNRPELVVGTGERARIFRLGDRVLQTRNDYDREVMNGDIGEVVAVDPREGEVRIRFAHTEAAYGRKDLGNVDLAYALTIHKSQGSEYPIVVVIACWGHYVMLQRNLLYTALTRAKVKAIVVGEQRAVQQCVSNNRPSRRNTRLAERMSD